MNTKQTTSSDLLTLDITPDTLIDAAQVAAVLHISVRTLRTLRHRGEVPMPIMIGRKILWRRNDLAQFLISKAS